MFMTFEKIDPPVLPKPEVEHPAYRAARMVRELHAQTIDMIDRGHVFLKDGVDVSAEMKAKCEGEMAVCEHLMRRAKYMDPKLWAPSLIVLQEAEQVVAEKMEQLAPPGDKAIVVDGQMLPEIGDYEQT